MFLTDDAIDGFEKIRFPLHVLNNDCELFAFVDNIDILHSFHNLLENLVRVQVLQVRLHVFPFHLFQQLLDGHVHIDVLVSRVLPLDLQQELVAE